MTRWVPKQENFWRNWVRSKVFSLSSSSHSLIDLSKKMIDGSVSKTFGDSTLKNRFKRDIFLIIMIFTVVIKGAVIFRNLGTKKTWTEIFKTGASKSWSDHSRAFLKVTYRSARTYRTSYLPRIDVERVQAFGQSWLGNGQQRSLVQLVQQWQLWPRVQRWKVWYSCFNFW